VAETGEHKVLPLNDDRRKDSRIGFEACDIVKARLVIDVRPLVPQLLIAGDVGAMMVMQPFPYTSWWNGIILSDRFERDLASNGLNQLIVESFSVTRCSSAGSTSPYKAHHRSSQCSRTSSSAIP